MLARAALGGIWMYQTYMSPRKGFRCAHSVVHSSTGCSGYAKQEIQNHGFFRSLPLIRQRFRDCKVAYYTLQNTRNEPEQPKKIKKSDSCGTKIRDGCCDAAIYEGCDAGQSCFGRSAIKSIKGCDADCDVCSCG